MPYKGLLFLAKLALKRGKYMKAQNLFDLIKKQKNHNTRTTSTIDQQFQFNQTNFTQSDFEKLQKIEIIAQLRKMKCQILWGQTPLKNIKKQFLALLADPTFQTEKVYFKFAKLLESTSPKPNNLELLTIIENYQQSILRGHQYIYQSFPTIIRLWLDKAVPRSKIENDQNVLKIFHLIRELFNKVEPFKLTTIIQTLISRVEHENIQCQEIIENALGRIASKFPKQSVWWLLPLKYFDYNPRDQNIVNLYNGYNNPQQMNKCQKFIHAQNIFRQLKNNNPESFEIIMSAEKFYKNLIDFMVCRGFQKNNQGIQIINQKFYKSLENQSNKALILPLKRFLFPKLPDQKSWNQMNFKELQDYNPFDQNYIYIEGIVQQVEEMQSKEKPLKIKFIISNKQQKNFLLKYESTGDVRKESRTIDFINFLNVILEQNNQTKLRNFQIPSFSIIPMTKSCGLVEWCDNTITIKSKVEKLWEVKNLIGSIPSVLQKFYQNNIQNVGGKYSQQVWNELKKVQPVLQYHFFQNFEQDKNKWYSQIENYTKTLASTSIFCYIIGLGDRHTDNILLETKTGKVIHIDFDCIFGRGQSLNIPEIIDFRLTTNIEAPLGAFKAYGLFRFYLNLICKAFQKNVENIKQALDSFINDPLNEQIFNGSDNDVLQKFKDIENKINFTNFSGNVDKGVDILIDKNKESDTLMLMYFGWQPNL